ncbi:MAG: hypothetical protein JST54_29085 [Deltaproteobacteria bacterium]|nr:hypothetical protein [Deltaproteobacteria bacterium]
MKELRAAADERRSGEFVCVADAVEIHVYLQNGRVAWATDSNHPFAFTRHLGTLVELPPEVFREVLESCRGSRAPVGETLVAWGLASAAQVRAALRRQVELALETVVGLRGGQTLFLARTYRPYDPQLTFELEALLSEIHEPAAAPPTGLDSIDGALLRRLSAAIHGLEWAEILDGASVVERTAREQGPSRVPAGLVENTVLDGALYAVTRSSRGALVGLSLGMGARRSLWCRLGASALLGRALSDLCRLAGTVTDESASRPLRRPWELQLEDDDLELSHAAQPVSWGRDHRALDTILDFMGKAPDLLAAFVGGPEGSEPLAGISRRGLSPEQCAAIARRRSALLNREDLLPRAAPDAAGMDLHELGLRLRALGTLEQGLWCFAGQQPGDGDVLWVFARAAVPQGLVWAYLTSLGRQLLSPESRSRSA